MTKKTALCLMGPTASGKTALALEIARQHPIEIISVDSALIYRDMNIGTAKPTPEELASVPHHLIDILNPNAHYSAGQFVVDAKQLIQEIQARGKTPVLVGGTMLYFKALIYGMATLPKQDPAIRAEIEAEATQIGWPALHQKLTTLDPISAAKIKPTDKQRIQRALEVFNLTGVALSTLQASKQVGQADLPYTFKSFALFPKDRSILHERIAKRVDAMLAAGFIDEIIALKQKYTLDAHLPSMRAVGYRQVWEYLAGVLPEQELRDRIIFATRQYAKRQLTWLKSWPDVELFDINESAQLAKQIHNILS